MSVKNLSIDLIRLDGGTQMRAELTQEVYMDYRDKWLAGVEFDPVDVFHDGSVYWLADGFHRFYGAREAKRKDLPCKIHQGTQRDAILFACGANATHGLRRKNEDKRKSVETMLNDEEWCKLADILIAEKCHVTQPFVSGIRKQLITVISSPAAKTANEPRMGRDGKKRRPPAKKPKPLSQSDAPAEPEPGADDFDPAKFKQPKPGSEKKSQFKDATIDDLFGKLMRAIDDRWNKNGGHGNKYRICLNATRAAVAAWNDWKAGRGAA